MDVDKYAPFTSSPLDASRGRGRRLMFSRLRPQTLRSPKIDSSAVVLIVTQPATMTLEQTTIPQLGGSSNGKNTTASK
jgi:hypothetical protein